MFGIAPLFRRQHAPVSLSGDVTLIRVGPVGLAGGEPRPKGWKRPHSRETVEAVRALVELTSLNQREIAARTGVDSSQVCRWGQAFGWTRPTNAPARPDAPRSERLRLRLQERSLAARALAIAERAVDDLERDPTVDALTLGTALAMLDAARLALEREPRRRRAEPPGEPPAEPEPVAPAQPVAPADPPEDGPARKPLGRLPSPHTQEVLAAWEAQRNAPRRAARRVRRSAAREP